MEDLKKLADNPKEWFLEQVSTSRCVCVGPCLVQFINPIPTSTDAAAIIKVFDGQNDQGALKCELKHQYTYPCCSFPKPAYFRRGLYIDLGQNVDGACVQYLPLRD